MLPTCIFYPVLCRKIEKESPERGRKRFTDYLPKFKKIIKIEKESPERGRKLSFTSSFNVFSSEIEKESPERGRKLYFTTFIISTCD